MKKKAIEKIPYLGLKQVSRGQDVKYIGVTAVKTVGHEKHLFLEMYRNEKRINGYSGRADRTDKERLRHLLP